MTVSSKAILRAKEAEGAQFDYVAFSKESDGGYHTNRTNCLDPLHAISFYFKGVAFNSVARALAAERMSRMLRVPIMELDAMTFSNKESLQYALQFNDKWSHTDLLQTLIEAYEELGMQSDAFAKVLLGTDESVLVWLNRTSTMLGAITRDNLECFNSKSFVGGNQLGFLLMYVRDWLHGMLKYELQDEFKGETRTDYAAPRKSVAGLCNNIRKVQIARLRFSEAPMSKTSQIAETVGKLRDCTDSGMSAVEAMLGRPNSELRVLSNNTDLEGLTRDHLKFLQVRSNNYRMDPGTTYSYIPFPDFFKLYRTFEQMKIASQKHIPTFYQFKEETMKDYNMAADNKMLPGYLCPFVYEGITYTCVTQAVEATRARYGRDLVALKAIMENQLPELMQTIGARVIGLGLTSWNADLESLVFRINKAKFDQHPELQRHLCSIKEEFLVWNSKADNVLGVAAVQNDRRIFYLCKWPGRNLLGVALTNLRDLYNASPIKLVPAKKSCCCAD